MRKVLVQRLQPLSMEWKKRSPFMRKVTYHYCGIFYLDSNIQGEEEFKKMLFDRFGEGTYQLLAWKKFPIMLRDVETKKKLSKKKIHPLFHIATVFIGENGRGMFSYNRLGRILNKAFDKPYESYERVNIRG